VPTAEPTVEPPTPDMYRPETLLVPGQSYSGNMPQGSLWRIRADAWVIDSWEVHEFRLFTDKHCSPPMVGAYKRFSSGYQPECVNPGGGRCKEGAAFDGNEDTYWRADCRELTGGCIPMTEYIGLDVQPTNLWKTAYIKNQTGELWRDERLLQADIVPTPEPTRFILPIQCIQIYQSKRSKNRADDITLQAWTGKVYQDMQRFVGAPGGVLFQRPAPNNAVAPCQRQVYPRQVVAHRGALLPRPHLQTAGLGRAHLLQARSARLEPDAVQPRVRGRLGAELALGRRLRPA
jgi:hypothetical protein